MDILIQPSSLSLVGSMNHFVIYATTDISFVLSDNTSGEVIVQHTYTPSDTNRIEIDLKNIILPLLLFKLQDVSTPYQQTDIVKTFNVVVTEVKTDGTTGASKTSTFKVLRGGVDHFDGDTTSFLQQNFLTWQPNVKPVTYYTPEFLTYYATVAATVRCKAYLEGGITKEFALAQFSAGQCWTIPVQYAIIAGKCGSQMPMYYDVWVENGSGQRMTYIQRYYATDMRSEEEDWILFENSLGGIDTFRAYGDSENTAEHTHNVAEIEEDFEEYRVDTTRKFKKNTGYLGKKERTWLLDFFPSLGKYIYISSYIRRIVVTDSDVSYNAKELPSTYNFTYKYADARPYLNIPRVDTPQKVLNIKVPELGSFTIAPRLVEFPRLTLSGGALFPVQNPYSEQWTVTTAAAILEYLIHALEADYSGGGGIGHTHPNISVLNALSRQSQYLLLDSLKISAGFADMAARLSEKSTDWNKILRKDIADEAKEVITFAKGLVTKMTSIFKQGVFFGDFTSGALGTGGAVTIGEDGSSSAEFDYLSIRKTATFRSVTILELKHIGGELGITSGAMKASRVEETKDAYRCYFDTTDGKRRVYQEFIVGDQARCQAFRLSATGDGMLTTKYYWRLVVNTGDDYIDLSKNDCDAGSGVPEVDDNIIQLGYRGTDHPERQSAIILSAVAGDAPSQKFYQNINSYNLVDRFVKEEGYDPLTGLFHCNIYGNFFVGDKGNMPENYVQYDQDGLKISGQVKMTAGSTLPDGRDIEAAVDKSDLESAIEGLRKDVGGLNDDVGRLGDEMVNIETDLTGLGGGLEALRGDVDGLTTGNENLLRNSGFTGDFVDEPVESGTAVDEGTEMWSSALAHWEATNAEVVETAASASGKAVVLAGGGLKQTLDEGLEVGETYVFSFKGKGTGLTFSVGGCTEPIGLSDVLERHAVRFKASASGKIFSISNANCTLMELQLVKGRIANTDWINSPKDNDKSLAYYQNLAYIANAIANGSTSVLGGLIMSQMLRVGNYRDGKMVGETGGMSGVYVDGNSPFVWGGGSMEQAFYTIAKYAENADYEATEDELRNLMAQFVVTHGGRAILNDVIVRGWVHAIGGVFRNITSPNGNFRLDEAGNLYVKNKGRIGGLTLNGSGLTNVDEAGNFNDEAYIIIRNDLKKVFAGIGTQMLPASAGGLRALSRIENYMESDLYGIGANYGMIVGARGARENIAIALTGGSISGLALKTLDVGFEQVTSATDKTGDLRLSISREVGDVYVSTQYYWRAKSEDGYTTKTRNVYLTLPTMDVYDDGHIIKFRRGTNSGGELHVIPGGSRYIAAADGKAFGFEVSEGESFILSDHDTYCYATEDGSKDFRLLSEGDSCEFVYHRNLSVTIGEKTYHGGWLQHKFPRNW